MLICKLCKENLPESEFLKNKSKRCKVCFNIKRERKIDFDEGYAKQLFIR